jgi:hypothetical protein
VRTRSVIRSARADILALAHRDAALDAGEIFAEGKGQDQRLALAQPVGGEETVRPAMHLAQRLDMDLEPGEPMAAMLLTLDQISLQPPVRRDDGADARPRRRQQRRRGGDGAGGGFEQIAGDHVQSATASSKVRARPSRLDQQGAAPRGRGSHLHAQGL